MDEPLHQLTIREASERIASGRLSPVTLLDACLARVDRLEPKLHAFITRTTDAAREQAREAEREIRAGRWRGPLHGIPIAHKDVLLTKGVRTTAHSALLADWVPDHDAAAVERLRQAGAISLGKTACHEFAYGTPGEDEAFPAARNPWHVDHMPGSSSSGSGTAVAAGMVLGATGTDTGGSVRHPAAACGIVGMKPTYGRVSLHGVIPLAPTLDHVGPLTRTVADNALMLQVLAGHDARDGSSLSSPVPDFSARIGQSIRGLRVGVPRRFLETVAHTPEVLQAFAKAEGVLRELGAELVDLDPAGLDEAFDTANLIIAYEAHRYHAENLKRSPEKLGAALKMRLARGAALSRADYEQALGRARALRDTYAGLFATRVDVMASPGREAPAETMAYLFANPGVKRGVTNRPYSLTGNPAITLPMGFGSEGLPIGIQFAAGHEHEPLLYQVAAAYEQAAGWHRRFPS
jgi:aspartyl-tRNA(Asn)/glutamyl-tRNA(Gln) amidotransferase subunit A